MWKFSGGRVSGLINTYFLIIQLETLLRNFAGAVSWGCKWHAESLCLDLHQFIPKSWQNQFNTRLVAAVAFSHLGNKASSLNSHSRCLEHHNTPSSFSTLPISNSEYSTHNISFKKGDRVCYAVLWKYSWSFEFIAYKDFIDIFYIQSLVKIVFG